MMKAGRVRGMTLLSALGSSRQYLFLPCNLAPVERRGKSVEIEGIVAVLSLALSTGLAFFYIRDRRAARFALTNEYSTALLEWHARVIEQLIVARCVNKDRNSEGHQNDLAHLSALIEQGRFMFPNINKGDEFGKEKPPAYQGYRNLALDFLVASYNLLRDPPSDETRLKLELLQRHFTSVVFEVVRPKERLETIRALTDRYFAKDQSFEDFLRHRDGAVISHIWGDPEPRFHRHLSRSSKKALQATREKRAPES